MRPLYIQLNSIQVGVELKKKGLYNKIYIKKKTGKNFTRQICELRPSHIQSN